MNEYDIIIIGTGPAGLSAAITSTIRNKKILLFGDDHSSQKVCKAHVINHLYLGLPSILGEDLAKAFLDHLKKFDIEIKNERVAKYSIRLAKNLQCRIGPGNDHNKDSYPCNRCCNV